MQYKEKLISLLQGLECEHIDDFIEKPSQMFEFFGKHIISKTK